MAQSNGTIRGVKGMPDVLPATAAGMARIEEAAARIFSSAGFREIRVPTLEPIELFERSVGEASDIVRKEMYTLEDLGGRRLALRPEGTAGITRALIENNLVQQSEEVRLWYRGPMYRYERPQKGRQRQFHQVGIEVFGNPSPLLDAEVIALNCRFLASLGIEDVTVRLNSLGGAEARDRYRGMLRAFARPELDALCEDCRARLEINPLRILDCKRASCQEIYAEAPRPLAALDDADAEHFGAVRASLERLGVPHEVDEGLVRGLDYYTRTVFEIRAAGLGAQDTVSAGGRYDGLVSQFGGRETPAMGFAAGVERILLAAEAAGAMPEPPRPTVAWVALDETARTEGLEWVERLRTRGLAAIHFLTKGSLKAQMRAANAAGVRFVLLRGEAERASQSVALKDLETGEQQLVELDVERLTALLGKG